MSNQRNVQGPTSEELRAELARVKYRRKYMSTLRSTIYALIALATVVLLAVLWLPVYRVTGDSMADTLCDGDIVVTYRSDAPGRGELIAFDCDNGKTLIKRVIAVGGDTVDIRTDGTVVVNGSEIDEPYLSGKAFGECDVELPVTVPDGYVFVMGDNRSESVDSRSSVMGCIPREKIVGRALARVWPVQEFEFYFSFEQLWSD